MNEKTKNNLIEDADVFSESGGDVALFWAGHMSNYIRSLTNAPMLYATQVIELLDFCRKQYDTIIIERAMKKTNPHFQWYK